MTFRNISTLVFFLCLSSFYLSAQASVNITDEDLTTGTYSWSADTTYFLDGRVVLESGGSLTIAPGTVIRAKSMASDGMISGLVITKGARIFAEGTSEDPIIFTSDEDDLAIPDELDQAGSGEWAGLVVLGNASIGTPQGWDFYEGFLVFDDPRYVYGGGSESDDEDNSGILKYVSIRHAAPFSGISNEHSAMVFAGVGRGTVIDHIEVIRTQTNGFSFIGGTVNAYHLVSAFCGGDAFNLDQGYRGKGQFWLGVEAGDRLLEISGNRPEADFDETWVNTLPDLANLTLVQGISLIDDLSGLGAVVFRNNAGGSLRNSTIINRHFVGASIQDWTGDTIDSWMRFQEGEIILEDNRWNSESRMLNWDEYSTVFTRNNIARAEPTLATYLNDNNQLSEGVFIRNSDVHTLGAFDPRPTENSELLTAGSPISAPGFTGVSYQGAFGPNDNWYSWTYLGSSSSIFQQISGQVLQSESDCTPGDEALPAAGVTISLQSGNTTRYTTTNPDGTYLAYVPAGTTVLNIIPPSDAWAGCPPPGPVTLNDGEEVVVDLALRRLDNCPQLRVDIGAPFLRRGFQSTYHITYANTGGLTATQPEVMVVLDPLLTYQAATIPLADQRGDTLFFTVDDLPPLSPPQQFSLFVLVSLEATLGQEHCTTATIIASNDCAPGPEAELRVTGTCIGDSIRFEVQNVGSIAPLAPAPFVVIEDEVMLLQGTLTTPAGNTDVFTFPADNQTFHFSTFANPDNPLSGKATATTSCSNDPVVPFASFASEGPLPNVGIDCQPNIGAYDPNDKSAVPLGLTNRNVVPEEVRLDYRIRFQNTGTDTAFTVVVVDTLPASLDPATFVMGTYSHPCSWKLEGERTLRVTFDHIMLPDSNINEPASNGFFRFNIQARPEFPLGTEIMNEADIYFDFNDPVRTNQTFHLIDRLKQNATGVEEPVLGADVLLLYPQPADERLNMTLKNGGFMNGSWVAYNIDGRLVAGGSSNGTTQQINITGWSPGFYVLVLRDQNQRLLGRKRFVVKN
jgi:uncharacterized repeat protein (TIGR01451 family)